MTTCGLMGKSFLLPVFLCGGLAGCGESYSGPELQPVAGEVLMDGKPLAKARVTFTPKAGGRSASGMTNAAGAYVLEYTDKKPGIPAGDYAVTVSTYETGEVSDGMTAPPAAPETVPITYNKKSTLTSKVPGDASAYRLELKSTAGAIAQPDIARGMN